MDQRIEKYAKLLVGFGMNVQPGQTLVINSPVETAEFTRLCAAHAYKLGAREVIVRWSDEFISRETYLHAADEIFDTVRPWKAKELNTLALEDAAFLRIDSDDPDGMNGIDHGRMIRASRASGEALKVYRELQMSDKIQWCIGGVPNRAWAMKVFPGISEEEAVSKLWDAILATMYVTEDNDPEEAWRRHNADLTRRKELLTEYNFKSLHYVSAGGTDLTIELPEGHYWEGGDSVSGHGVRFNANMPTEEIFTAPKRDGVNGRVVSTKPFCLGGEVIDKFALTFERGRIVGVETENRRHKELLEAETALDEGAAYLGEVALVPYDSPISRMGILFFNTLYDENASCHLAFGASYPTVRGGADMTPEQRHALGLNDSITHEDFMVGSADLNITGLTHDGREIPVFIDGNFAF